jgi:hypothetical protein
MASLNATAATMQQQQDPMISKNQTNPMMAALDLARYI